MSEPAFPGIAGEDGCGPYTYQDTPGGSRVAILHNQGMSLLDYFAGQALTGMLAHATRSSISHEQWAKRAYNFAEAMMAEREKRCAARSEKK